MKLQMSKFRQDDIQAYLQAHFHSMIADLSELVSFPSIYNSNGFEGAPFGKDIKDALEWLLNLADTWGMQTKNYDGYAGEITIGFGDDMIGILCHIDVVSEGNGWDTSPFQVTIKSEKLYGRGVCDNKGPLISTLYAMRFLKDHNLIPAGVSIRMIIGTDEEEGWRSINHYLDSTEKLPDFSIVPDANFPLINSEKGLLDFDLKDNSPINQAAPLQLIAFNGGNGRNIVPDEANCVLKCESPIKYLEMLKNQNQLNDQQLAYQIEKNCLKIQATGKSAHAMTPEKGKNAIDILINGLNLFGKDFSHEEFVQKYMRFIADDINGKKTSINSCDSISGELTLNIGKVLFDPESHQILLNANVRHPVTITGTREQVFTEMSAAGFLYEEIDYLPPLYFEQDDPFIKKLMGVYQSCTEDTITAPLSIGGATFARAMKNAVCFGPLFPGEEELAHEANESLSLESFRKMTDIYIQALITLMDGGIF